MALMRRILLASLAAPCPAVATNAPTLEISGAIASPAPRRLDMAALDGMGRIDLTTRTPWTRGPQHFSGLPFGTLLSTVGARGTTLRALALNDYSISMPIDELVAADGFLATRQDGQPIPVRQRGPFWIIFPWSARPELETGLHRQRSVWQLQRIDIA